MTRKQLVAALTAGTIAAGAIAGAVYAKERRDTPTNEVQIIAKAKVSMAQAIAAAEQATGGKAVGSEIEEQDGTVHFKVTVLKDNVRQKILIDTQTAQVVKTVVAQHDRFAPGIARTFH